MTDGIIQEVINLHNNNECKCKHACHNLLRIQQELIEKIKQELIEIVKFNDQIESTVGEKDFQYFVIKLIGDNQE